ncbi:Peroxisomal acyl-coenzyme A oxidase 1 [Smittium culicis]|uniref:Acyl-coenzyme A oxidase n=2 Tax=Smittium culicis TaxID=133412 RepID=A0A1R1YEH9_9FUNG|nr:Peroxisomal acyl-coenzyme A oxidase 1 [Smittium culicis]
MKFSTDLIPSKVHTSETLSQERRKASFDTKEMDKFINGQKRIDSREKALKIIRQFPDIFDQTDMYYLSRTEKLEKSYKQEKKIVELLRKGEIDSNDITTIVEILDNSTPFDLTRAMFIPTLEQQCNDEQREAFLKPALDYRIIGCYAQTEVGHGSNIRNIETTATFIEETDEFEVNSPTLTSTKWWIGSLGISSTHACVMAQVFVKGKHIGLFPIIVPIRSLVDHKPLPGVNVGDIGPKMGYNTMDNGFLNLDKVRVPRFNLLQKYISVSRNRIVSKPQNIDPRVTYGTMVLVRANITSDTGRYLAKAITIAIRYSSMRRQFGSPGQPETPVLDYPIVQYRLIPILAKTYAMIGMSHEFYSQYEKTASAISNGDFSSLKEMHAVSCGLKRWTSDTCVYGVDTCRHCCGGHGFSQFSGLNEFFANIYPTMIVEGDNYMLAKQVASYLVKSAIDIKLLKSVESNDTTNAISRFLAPSSSASRSGFFSWRNKSASEISTSRSMLLDLLSYRFVTKVANLAAKIQSNSVTMDDSSIESQAISSAHAEYIVCLYHSRHLEKLPASSNLAPILTTLFNITALDLLTKNSSDLYEFTGDASMSHKQITSLQSEYISLIKAARVQAVPLVDSLAVPEEKLNSSLGKSDGFVYEDLIKRALNEPVNRDITGDKIRADFYNNYIGPVLKSNSTRL